ncbi:MAG: hypothetical protein U0228_17720 [Myxococcaceae bacterium]
MARDLNIEAKLIENPTDSAQYQVYADFLLSKGDPRGELISLQQAGKHAEASALLDKHADVFLGPLKDFRVTFDGTEEDAFAWRSGFIRSATLSLDVNTVGDVETETPEAEITLEAGLGALLDHPSGALLEQLTIPINMLDDGGYFAPALAPLLQKGCPSLRSLRIGRFSCCGGPGGEGDYEYEISWTGVGDLGGLWKAVPRLESLVIQSGLGGSSASGEPDALGTIVHDKLKSFRVITGGLSAGCARSIAQARLPALETLEVWFGDPNYGGDTTIDDLAPLFEGQGFPKLKHLALNNAPFENELARALITAPITRQLESLSLRYGTLDDTGAAHLLLLPNAKQLTVDVRDSYLSPAMIERLQAGVKKLESHPQQEQRGDRRYVSLSE